MISHLTIDEVYARLLTDKTDMQAHMPRLAELGCDKSVTEIGFRTGVSAVAWLHGGCGSLVSIDIRDCPIPEYLREDDRFTFVNGNSREIAPWHTDIVFFDGDHSFEGVLADIWHWQEHAVEFLVFHDTHTPKWPGVRWAINVVLSVGTWKVKADYKDCYGLTILERA